MAEQQPNDASRKSKAEGERFSGEEFDQNDTAQSGISNRPRDEETTNQDAVPPRGESQPGAGAGRGGDRSDDKQRFRASLDTPRRYDQPIEDDDDPVMPSDDATVNTKI